MLHLKNGPHPITSDLREAVFSAWGKTCAYCKIGCAEHVDHIFPHSKGGADHVENYTAACAPCNLMKTDLVLARGFLEILLAKAKKKAPRVLADIARRKASRRPLAQQPDITAIKMSPPSDLISEILLLEALCVETRTLNYNSGSDTWGSAFEGFITIDLPVSTDLRIQDALTNDASRWRSRNASGVFVSQTTFDRTLQTQKIWTHRRYFRALEICRDLSCNHFSFRGDFPLGASNCTPSSDELNLD